MKASLSVFLQLLPLLVTQTSAQLAGNENYAEVARSLLRGARMTTRSSTTYPLSSTAITFTVGEDDTTKHYLSPVGPKFKRHTLVNDWGLEGSGGDAMLVTVFDVEGQVTCDSLGQQISSYASSDDVWDQVS
jgi:hypothetical protein